MIAVAIVVVVIPIAIGMPTVFVFVPPAMSAAPAILARLVQFMPGLISLFAFASMMLDGFMKMMIGPGDAKSRNPTSAAPASIIFPTAKILDRSLVCIQLSPLF